MLSTEQFKKDTFSALNNPQLRGNFKRAMSGLMQKRLAVFPDDQEFQQLREIGHSARVNALHKLPELLQQLEVIAAKTGFRFIGRKQLITPISWYWKLHSSIKPKA